MGTYVLDDVWAQVYCKWDDYADFNASPCTSEPVTSSVVGVYFSDDGTNTVVTIIVTYHAAGAAPYVVNWIKYEKTFSGRVACNSFTDEAIPYHSKFQAAGKDECDYGITKDDALLTTS